MPQQHNLRSANPQLDEAKITEYFTQKSEAENLASKLALVCYVLTHQEAIYAEQGIYKLQQLLCSMLWCVKHLTY